MVVTVKADSDDNKGGELYELIARKSIEDLGLSGSVEALRMYIRSDVPLFIIKIKFREFVGRNTLGELSHIVERENGSKIILDSEIDLGDALKTLWNAFGRDKVEQAGRMEIIVTGEAPKNLESLKIRDLAIDVSVKINELASRIIPEGFRVRHVVKEPGLMTFVAAEDPIKDEWKSIASALEVEG